MESYIREEKLKFKEEVLKLQAERDYFISNKELVDLGKRNAFIKEKILLLKESLLKKKDGECSIFKYYNFTFLLIFLK